jgi:hypothetical protein
MTCENTQSVILTVFGGDLSSSGLGENGRVANTSFGDSTST